MRLGYLPTLVVWGVNVGKSSSLTESLGIGRETNPASLRSQKNHFADRLPS